jgi:hypothetical protein
MTTITPPARNTTLHTAAGSLLVTTEATTLTAGETIVFQNTGNVVLHLHITTAGTGTVDALVGANNQAVTLSVGDMLLGPYDPAIFGETITMTTATAVGTVATYLISGRFLNGLRNPFETNTAAADSN